MLYQSIEKADHEQSDVGLVVVSNDVPPGRGGDTTRVSGTARDLTHITCQRSRPNDEASSAAERTDGKLEATSHVGLSSMLCCKTICRTVGPKIHSKPRIPCTWLLKGRLPTQPKHVLHNPYTKMACVLRCG